MSKSTLMPDGSILIEGRDYLGTDEFKLDKPETIYLLRKGSEFEIKQLEDLEAGILEGYTVEVK